MYKGGFLYGTNILSDTPGEKYNARTAYDYILENMENASFLSQGAFGYILLIELREPTYPYATVKLGNPEPIPLKKILFKITFPNGLPSKWVKKTSISQFSDDPTYSGKDNLDKFKTSKLNLEMSIKKQLQIYKESFFDDKIIQFDPICPAILNFSLGIDIYNKNKLGRKILEATENEDDKKIIEEIFFNDKLEISFTCMELLECYQTLHSLLTNRSISDEKKLHFKSLAILELYRLYKLGYRHGDLNLSNVMVNPNEKYLTNTEDDLFGKAMLIDFDISSSKDEKIDNNHDDNFIDYYFKEINNFDETLFAFTNLFDTIFDNVKSYIELRQKLISGKYIRKKYTNEIRVNTEFENLNLTFLVEASREPKRMFSKRSAEKLKLNETNDPEFSLLAREEKNLLEPKLDDFPVARLQLPDNNKKKIAALISNKLTGDRNPQLPPMYLSEDDIQRQNKLLTSVFHSPIRDIQHRLLDSAFLSPIRKRQNKLLPSLYTKKNKPTRRMSGTKNKGGEKKKFVTKRKKINKKKRKTGKKQNKKTYQ